MQRKIHYEDGPTLSGASGENVLWLVVAPPCGRSVTQLLCNSMNEAIRLHCNWPFTLVNIKGFIKGFIHFKKKPEIVCSRNMAYA